MQPKRSPLSAIYEKNQRKVKATEKKARFLKTFAADDHKKIAQLIKKWLEED